MQFEPPLQPATLIRRYKRFLADIRLPDGTDTTAHIANPGAMTGLAEEGMTVWVQPSTDPKRKLKWSWHVVECPDGSMACVNTALANAIVKEAITTRAIPELANYTELKPEQKYGQNSRIDFLLDGPSPTYVEVKSVTLRRQTQLAEFPDSVTARGTKHLEELTRLARSGQTATMLFVIQHTGCTSFTIAHDIDPTYAAAFNRAKEAGVQILIRRAEISSTAIALQPTDQIPLI